MERWFGHLDNKAIRRGVFLSVADLQSSIEALLNIWNRNPKPFISTATVASIQEAHTLPSDTGTNPARLQQLQDQETGKSRCLVNLVNTAHWRRLETDRSLTCSARVRLSRLVANGNEISIKGVEKCALMSYGSIRF